MQRVLPFAGIHNFRDYGGYPVAGGRVRAGMLFRSAQHRDATADDLDAVSKLGLRVVIDLRGASERAASPCPRPRGFAARVILADAETSGLAPHLAAARDVSTPEQARAAMHASYRGMPFRPVLARVMRGLFAALAAGETPSLVHCMAGKDRTGLACALVHAALGVHHDDMIADYLLTNTAGDPEERIRAGAIHVRAAYGRHVCDEAVRTVMAVEPDYLATAFAAIAARAGGLDAYLAEWLGVDAAARDAIRRHLIA